MKCTLNEPSVLYLKYTLLVYVPFNIEILPLLDGCMVLLIVVVVEMTGIVVVSNDDGVVITIKQTYVRTLLFYQRIFT